MTCAGPWGSSAQVVYRIEPYKPVTTGLLWTNAASPGRRNSVGVPGWSVSTTTGGAGARTRARMKQSVGPHSHAWRYARATLLYAMVRSFKCSDTESLAKGDRVRRFANIATVARRKLRQLEIAMSLEDLRVPPGNRLEVLRGKRAGQFSIRINDHWRVCFRWKDAGAEDVEIVDYH
jgi:toxin HigB-1